MSETDYAVIVVGGGPSGIGAAIAAARLGQKTLLLEKQAHLGGMGTNALVNNFCNAHFDGHRFIIGGIFAEIREELIKKKAIYATRGLEPYNHHVFAEVVNRLCAEAGVEVMTSAVYDDVCFEADDRVVVTIVGRTIRGRVIVDASGDAVIAAQAGAPFWPRMEIDRSPMPLTYCYLFGPVDIDVMKERFPDSTRIDPNTGEEYVYIGGQKELVDCVRLARAAGELTIPRERIAVAYSVPGTPEVLSVNFGRVTIDDPTCPRQLAEAEKQGLAQVAEGEAFFRKYVPGCENGKAFELARQIGVRESRQIQGQYRLTKEDVLGYRQFDDVIAQCCYSIDIHDPSSDRTVMIGIPKGKHYDIPYRSLLPVNGPLNLIVAGRSISATQDAMSSFRVSPSVMAIGEAAGTAAALCARKKVSFSALPYEELRAELLERGGILE